MKTFLFYFLICIACMSCNKKEAPRSILQGNFREENIVLLSSKYNIDEIQLVNLIKEYEVLTTGSSVTEFYFDQHYEKGKKYTENKNLVKVRDALIVLSVKYKIPTNTISEIIIINKLLEKEYEAPPEK